MDVLACQGAYSIYPVTRAYQLLKKGPGQGDTADAVVPAVTVSVALHQVTGHRWSVYASQPLPLQHVCIMCQTSRRMTMTDINQTNNIL